MSWLENCEVSIINGDLFDQKVDALVIPVECSLTFTHVLGREFLNRYGESLKVSVSRTCRKLFNEGVPLGSSLSIPIEGAETTRWAVLVAWWDQSSRYTQSLIGQCVSTALRKAFETQSRSAAVPLFGVNSLELDLSDLYAAIPKVLREFDRLRTSNTFSVKDLRFVCRKPHVVEEMRQVLQLYL